MIAVFFYILIVFLSIYHFFLSFPVYIFLLYIQLIKAYICYVFIMHFTLISIVFLHSYFLFELFPDVNISILLCFCYKFCSQLFLKMFNIILVLLQWTSVTVFVCFSFLPFVKASSFAHGVVSQSTVADTGGSLIPKHVAIVDNSEKDLQ